MVKIQEKTDINDNESKIQRTIQVATIAVIIKKCITTSVTLEIRPNKGKSNVNVVLPHRNIFSAVKSRTLY